MIYLIDSENTGSAWLGLLKGISKKDKVYIFATEKSSKITYSEAGLLADKWDQVDVVMVERGTKNALDFQLATYLGYLLRAGRNGEYIIISGDTGYDPVADFWNSRGKKVKRMTVRECLRPEGFLTHGSADGPALPSADTLPAVTGGIPETAGFSTLRPDITEADAGDSGKISEQREKLVRIAVGNVSGDVCRKCIRILNDAKDKSMLHTRLCQTFGMDKGREYYYGLRDQLDGYKFRIS